MVEIEISRLEDLDPYRYEQALREIDMPDPDEEGIVYCRAFDEAGFEVGRLIIDAAGLVLGVEVEPEHRRQGVATRMLGELRGAGYRIEHDWDNMRDDGAAWVASLGEPQRPNQPE